MESFISFYVDNNAAQSAYNMQKATFDFCLEMFKFYDKKRDEVLSGSEKKLLESDPKAFVENFKDVVEAHTKLSISAHLWATMANIHRALFYAMHIKDMDMIKELSDQAMDISNRALEMISSQDKSSN